MAAFKLVDCSFEYDLNEQGEVELFDRELRTIIGTKAGWSYDCGANELTIMGASANVEDKLSRYGQVQVMEQ